MRNQKGSACRNFYDRGNEKIPAFRNGVVSGTDLRKAGKGNYRKGAFGGTGSGRAGKCQSTNATNGNGNFSRGWRCGS